MVTQKKNALIKLSKLLNQAATQPSLKTIPEEPQALKPIAIETLHIKYTPVPIANPVPVLPHIRPIIPTALPNFIIIHLQGCNIIHSRGCKHHLFFSRR